MGNEYGTWEGLSYLELKMHLMLNYCTNIAFYIHLKSQGISVKDHPAVSQLFKLRTVMEKMNPLDQKLKYQIDKLAKLANMEEEEKGKREKREKEMEEKKKERKRKRI